MALLHKAVKIHYVLQTIEVMYIMHYNKWLHRAPTAWQLFLHFTLYADIILHLLCCTFYTCMSEMQQYCELTCCTNGFLDIDAPTNLLTREVTEDSALVTWDKVQADIDGYMLSYSSIDGSAQEVRVAADSTSYRFTALKPGVLYSVYVWAVKGPRSSRKATTEAETGYLIQAGSVALRPCFLLLPRSLLRSCLSNSDTWNNSEHKA